MSATHTALLRACSLLLCLAAGSWQLSIKEFSVPKAIELGKDAELRCQYELDANDTEAALFVKWWWRPESSTKDERKPIYQRIAGQAAQSVHHSNFSKIVIKDNDTIILTNVTPVDSGKYECEVSDIKEIRQHGKLAVFSMGTGPTLNVSEIEDTTDNQNKHRLLLIECQAEEVAPKPVLSVTVNGHEVNMATVIEDVDNNGFYSVYGNATFSTEDMNESEVRCEIFYSDADIAHPAYVDVKMFTPTGYDTQSTTGVPEDTTEPESTPGSLPISRDDGVRLHSSWILLTSAAVLIHVYPYFNNLCN